MSLMIYLMLMSVDGHVKDEPNVSGFSTNGNG